MGLLAGIACMCLGGVLAGLYTVPMNRVKGWAWENVCFVYAIYGMVLFPWILVFFSVTDALRVYQEAPPAALGKAIGMGVLWGVGSTLFCLGVDALGSSLAFSIILGLTAGLGSAVPLVALHPHDIASNEGIMTWVGMAVILIGLVFLGRAGKLKEREQRGGAVVLNSAATEGTPLVLDAQHNTLEAGGARSIKPNKHKAINGTPPSSPKLSASSSLSPSSSSTFLSGLIICLFSGVFSPALNFGITFGSDITDTATRLGTPSALSNNATWSLVVGGGFIINLIWWSYQMTMNKTWGNFWLREPKAAPLHNTMCGVLAGGLWYGGNVLYGVGGQLVGDLGTVLGFPIFLSLMIITSSVAGVITGEWRGTSVRSRSHMLGGMLLLVVAVVLIGVGPIL
ncbi:hypothetical protein PTSG_00056 [Salpingoeca rosetta]|uniref:Rhamnose/proton symporter RhaT n=1 Tax=Salpingoeca rosetta (strain ATCC 50818 / BSB-021) TaxID=946362 RepID=F2TVE3_SALR5|nr:uncharacterized protein PTSG_00056 [Salpingoeca rosetta]EGD72039.1 hypothetical protein PTSG_00056 [Salpingoeca rosetta]|eukprot:XP_004998611.1 hypothetical protein PTSG_00056 [Salpingoeca rosetta]